jgi:hypothetical protein
LETPVNLGGKAEAPTVNTVVILKIRQTIRRLDRAHPLFLQKLNPSLLFLLVVDFATIVLAGFGLASLEILACFAIAKVKQNKKSQSNKTDDRQSLSDELHPS